MGDAELTPFEQAELKYLRNRVDQLETESLRVDAVADSKNNLMLARSELRRFVIALRKKGIQI
jgi:hypothetical protein